MPDRYHDTSSKDVLEHIVSPFILNNTESDTLKTKAVKIRYHIILIIFSDDPVYCQKPESDRAL